MPPVHFHHVLLSEIIHHGLESQGDIDPRVGGETPDAFGIQMIVMAVGNQHVFLAGQGRKLIEGEARTGFFASAAAPAPKRSDR